MVLVDVVLDDGTVVVLVDVVVLVVVDDVVLDVVLDDGTVVVLVDVVVVVVELVVGGIVAEGGVGNGAGFGIGRPDIRAPTTSRMNDARASAPAAVKCTESTYEAGSLAAGVSAQSASTHRCRAAHHARAASE